MVTIEYRKIIADGNNITYRKYNNTICDLKAVLLSWWLKLNFSVCILAKTKGNSRQNIFVSSHAHILMCFPNLV